ncbi:hypothetical protein ABBQ38_012267 [Trebouxia sp. C0009 RCD-2024]
MAQVQVQKPARKFEDSDFAYVDQELPSELFKAFKTTFIGKPVPEQSISNERLRELGFEGPDNQLWLRYCIERQLAYW